MKEDVHNYCDLRDLELGYVHNYCYLRHLELGHLKMHDFVESG